MTQTKFSQWVQTLADASQSLLAKYSGQKKRTMDERCLEILSSKGEALGTALANELVQDYLALDLEGKAHLFALLLDQFSLNIDELLAAAQAFKASEDQKNYAKLIAQMESPRQRLFGRINMAPRGTETLVKMRSDLLSQIRQCPELQPVDIDLKNRLEGWFNRGFLSMEEISWKTPAHILEKLIAYEAVHQMQGWDDLRRRLAADRRCFAFFHPALPDEPLIFVEVALTQGLSSSIQTVLNDPLPKESIEETKIEADTAIFYSISNCQTGLQGISFGNFLIKQVVVELKKELPQLRQFATLSPIPGLAKWLNSTLENDASEFQNICVSLDLNSEAAAELKNFVDKVNTAPGRLSQFKEMDGLNADIPVQALFLKLAAVYMIKAKKGDQPFDPVSRFHLGNGARIERLNWMGDRSVKGAKESFGLLVNYIYELKRVESNHEAFINDKVVAYSSEIKSYLE